VEDRGDKKNSHIECRLRICRKSVLTHPLNPKETTLAPSKPKTVDPDAQAKKAQREADGKKAMAEYEAEAAATRAKTEKLRALRLARDAALGGAAAAKPSGARTAGTKSIGTKSAGKRSAKSSKPKSVSLSDYQKALDGSGRNR
jgi:hypothetical protein